MIILTTIAAGAAAFAGLVGAILAVLSAAMRADERRADAALDFEAHVDQAIAVSNEQAESAVRWTAEERARLRRAIEADIASVQHNH